MKSIKTFEEWNFPWDSEETKKRKADDKKIKDFEKEQSKSRRPWATSLPPKEKKDIKRKRKLEEIERWEKRKTKDPQARIKCADCDFEAVEMGFNEKTWFIIPNDDSLTFQRNPRFILNEIDGIFILKDFSPSVDKDKPYPKRIKVPSIERALKYATDIRRAEVEEGRKKSIEFDEEIN